MENSIIIIGGISGGIGSALAKRLVQKGNTVAGFARDEKRLNNLQAEHPKIKTCVCDATDPEAVKASFDENVSSTQGKFTHITAGTYRLFMSGYAGNVIDGCI